MCSYLVIAVYEIHICVRIIQLYIVLPIESDSIIYTIIENKLTEKEKTTNFIEIVVKTKSNSCLK